MDNQGKVYAVMTDPMTQQQVSRVSGQMGLRCRVFDNAESFFEHYDAMRPACLVTEFRLPEMNGVQFQEHLLRRRLHLPCVFLASAPMTRYTVRVMQNGAVTVLDKPAEDNELTKAIETGLKRDRQCHRIDSHHGEIRRRIGQLTPKEGQVLELMMDGCPNKVIAKRLNVSLRTVEVRRQQIFRKTATKSVAELVRLVLEAKVPVLLAATSC